MNFIEIPTSKSKFFVKKSDLDKGIYIYGAGELGLLAIEYCESCRIKILGIVDNHRTGTVSRDMGAEYLIFAPADVPYNDRVNRFVAVAVATAPFTPIADFLINIGWRNVVPFYSLTSEKRSEHPLGSGWLIGETSNKERDSVLWISNNWSDPTSLSHYEAFLAWHYDYSELPLENSPIVINERYAIKPLLDYFSTNNFQFIDVGSHDGGAVRRLNDIGVYFSEYVLIEPDAISRDLLSIVAETLFKHGCNVMIFDNLIGELCGPKPFKEGLGYCSQIWDESTDYKDAVSIDELDFTPDFIKIHTEGTEFMVLKGAQNTIRKFRPALAFSIYHTRNGFCHDIYEAMKMFDNYRWYFRLHSYQGTGAFVYAIPI
ncbi:FkbM family methyltransferase [Aeromonas sp.]|uniref:FkbM family methyltransferase n=1 Tax=Aeromonas sp. TaxID=647 RepID=UPI00258512BE|nr:FkbM family methyltransferase [Aeromonas sp.]MCX7132356.1 FkbM family methyltransferase [Aeromonas sp.]